MTRFVTINRDTSYLLPPSVDEWLPGKHLARFVVGMVDQLDLKGLIEAYAGRGSAAQYPSVLLGLLLYGYATGVHASRAIERATYDSVAFRYVAGNTHPDHDTLATFRRRFIAQIEPLFVQVLLLARTAGILKLGVLCLDGTKIKANASRHSALSHEHLCKLQAQIAAEVKALLARAEAADQSQESDGMDVPAELTRREVLQQRLAEARARIEAMEAERQAREKAEYAAKVAAREAKAEATGKKPRGKPPAPPAAGINPKAQVNLTDAESRIMPRSGGGFDQAYNAQLSVEIESRLIVTTGVTQSTVDKQQVVPALDTLAALPAALQGIHALVTDNGFTSAANVKACAVRGITPLFSLGRDGHHISLAERFACEPALEPTSPPPPDPLAAMRHLLKTKAGRTLYALRKSTVEPVIGIVKSVCGFTHFSLRGLHNVTGEWNLACLAYNMKRLHRLQMA